MKRWQIAKHLKFGYELSILAGKLVAHEEKPDQYPYPTKAVEGIGPFFAEEFKVPPNAIPARLSCEDVPLKFIEVIDRSNPTAALIMGLGFCVLGWWEEISRLGKVPADLEQFITRIFESLDQKIPGVKSAITDLMASFRDVPYDESEISFIICDITDIIVDAQARLENAE